MSCRYTYNGVTYNQEQLVELMYNELTQNPEKYKEIGSQLLKADTQADVISKLQSINRQSVSRNKTTGWIGLSEYMELRHHLSNITSESGIYLFPHYNEESRIKNTIEKERKAGREGTDDELREELLAQISDEKLNSHFGTLFHDLVGTGCLKGTDSTEYKKVRTETINKLQTITDDSGKTLFELITAGTSHPYTIDEVINKMDEVAKNIVESLQKQFPGSIPFNELHVSVDTAKMPTGEMWKGVKGRPDLILVSPDGIMHIVDFKVATRRYNNWFAVKKYHTEYQLGFYRQMLAANGLDPKKMKLYIQPIYLEKGNISELTMEDTVDILTPTKNRFSHLDLQDGEFFKNIQELIPVPIKIDTSESPTIIAAVEDTFSKMVSYDPVKRAYGKDEFVNRFIEVQKKNGEVRYVFDDWISGKRIVKKSIDEFTKDGGYIDQFNEKLKRLTAEQTRSIVDNIRKQKGKTLSKNGYDFLNEENHTTDSYQLLAHTFSEYMDPVYELVDIPALVDMGIIAFENTQTGVINFVVITDQNLDARVDNNGQSTVLGCFIKNDKAKNLPFDPLDSNAGNMELLKVMHVINTLKELYPDKIQNKQIGSIEAINIYLAQQRIGNPQSLSQNYGYLSGQQGVHNNFDSGDIEFAEYWKVIEGYVKRQFVEEGLDPKTKDIIKKVKWDARSKADKLRVLKKAIIELKNLRGDLNWSDFRTGRNFDETDPVHMLYVLLNEAYAYYLGIPVNYSGELQKYGIQFGEVIKLLSIPFISDQGSILSNGYVSNGPLNGVEVSSPVSVPSQTLRALYQYFDIAFIKVRTEFQEERKSIEKITRDYISKRKSTANRLLWNDNEDLWRELMLKEENGKTLSKSLSLRDPYTDKTLSDEQKEFLKAILWEINKYQLNLSDELKNLHYPEDKDAIDTVIATDSAIITAISRGSYFYLPLRRANDFQRLKNMGRVGLTDWFDKQWDALKEDYDPRNLHGSHRSSIDSRLNENSITMYNAYEGMDGPARMQFIESQGINDFELDLDYLVSDVAFQSIRKKCFEDTLLIADALATTLHFIQQTTDMTYQTELDALDDQVKVDTGKGLIPKELEEASGLVGAVKRFNSLVVLSIRPMQFLKELTYGQLTNYSRAWALKHSSCAVSAKSVFEANKVIWGQSFRKYGDAFFGEGDITDYTVCEAINKQYGIANEDLNRTVDSSTLQRTGATHNMSRWMYIANSAPDYFNRLTLFVAKMMEDGCFEAHTLSENGTLVYDFSKDTRFSEIHKYGWNAKRTDEKFLHQKALFRAMASDFEREGISLITTDGSGNEVIKPLPRAYSIKQRDAIKEVADLAYGFYDHEAKSLIDHKFLGLIWKQFMTFLTAKTTLWFRGRPTSEGSNTSQGKFVHLERLGQDGKMHKIYREIVDEGGKLVVKLRLDSELTPEQIKTLEPQYEWKGDYVEGLAYSIMGIFHDIFHADWKHLKEDKQQLGNLKLALHDILMGWILYNILKFIFSGGTNKTKDVHPVARVLLRGTQDVGPQSIFTSLSWEPGFVTTLDNVKSDMYRNFNEGIDFERSMQRFGMFSDFMWNTTV